MSLRSESSRRISLAMPDPATLELLGSGKGPSLPPRRRSHSTQPRLSLSYIFPYLVGPAFLLALLIVSYFVFDVKIHVTFHRRSSLQPLSGCGSKRDNFTIADANEEPPFEDDGRWHGYAHYLKRLERIKGVPLRKAHDLQVAGRGPYGFAHFSAYRMQANAFAVIGFGARELHDSAAWSRKRCWWEEEGKPNVEGVVRVLYSEEHENLVYDTIVFQCWLANPTGAMGGVAMATIDGEDIILYREEGGKEHVLAPPNDKDLRHYVTECTRSQSEAVEPRAMLEHVEYHRHMGVDHFMLYDGGAFEERLASTMEEFLKQGVVEVVPFRGITKFEMPREGYHLALHDCLYRSRFTSKWVLSSGWDEYLYVPKPETFMSMLAKYDGKPWVTYGTRVWAINMCRPGPPIYGGDRWSFVGSRLPFAIERMSFRWPHIVCHGSPPNVDVRLCLNHAGERKYFCDPRQVETVHLHEVGLSKEGGLDLSFDDMHHQIFRNLHLQRNFTNLVCDRTVRDNEQLEWWVRDLTQAEYSMANRGSAIPFPT